MIHCAVPIDVPRLDAEDGGLDLFLFGDEQRESPGFVPEAWDEFEHQFKTCKRKKIAMGMGDYSDIFRPSLRPLLKGAVGKDDSARRVLDKMILKQHDKVLNAHAFLEGYLIGAHEGHHNWTTLDGVNLDQRFCTALKARFLGFAATTRLVIRGVYGNKPKRPDSWASNGHVVTMFTTHGNANGRKVPGALSWAENNLANSHIADIYAIGHGCKNATASPFERNEVRRVGAPGFKRSVPRIMAVGGFARGWTDGWESDYVERAGMSPQALGWVQITFRLVHRVANALAAGCPGRDSKTLDIDARNRYHNPPQD